MRIVETQERWVGETYAKDTLIIETPDPKPVESIVLKLDVALDAKEIPGDRNLEPRQGRVVDRDPHTVPLWKFARRFFAHEFPYLGPAGAMEMADKFFFAWKASP